MADSFKDMLLRWRKERDLPQKMAADALGVSMRTYQGWEAGEHMPNELMLTEIIRRMEKPTQ